ncbi:MAG: STAS domain-containing protein [Planctomycetes bacterium]|nr:STAS domain-containing protein [Planctomycetota bacterium]MBL7106718.1 STAS domain-containing protein [Phycisphaerae bacterium]
MDTSKPKISVDYVDGLTVIRFTDEKILEEVDILALQGSVMSVIESREKLKLILDFCNVEFLSSAVLGLLLRISKKVYENEGQLRLCCISPKIYEVFKITRLTNIFEIHDSLELAKESLVE